MSKPTEAYWNIELNCYCPKCKKSVDLLQYPDFWEGRNMEFGEHNTDRSNDVRVVCPECDAVFHVCCKY